jgi:hypothetical protein
LKILIFIGFLFSNSIYANSLYFTSSFLKDTEAKPIETNQHMFLNKPYTVRYWDMDYVLVLKKCEKNLLKIEHETYFTTPGKKQFLSAGIWSGKMSDSMELKQFTKNGKLKFKFIMKPLSIKND